jgi:hypothetical protein
LQDLLAGGSEIDMPGLELQIVPERIIHA